MSYLFTGGGCTKDARKYSARKRTYINRRMKACRLIQELFGTTESKDLDGVERSLMIGTKAFIFLKILIGIFQRHSVNKDRRKTSVICPFYPGLFPFF